MIDAFEKFAAPIFPDFRTMHFKTVSGDCNNRGDCVIVR
jgi:hypothetical protein